MHIDPSKAPCRPLRIPTPPKNDPKGLDAGRGRLPARDVVHITASSRHRMLWTAVVHPRTSAALGTSTPQIIRHALLFNIQRPKDPTHVTDANCRRVSRFRCSVLDESADHSNGAQVALVVRQPPMGHVLAPDVRHAFAVGGLVDVAGDKVSARPILLSRGNLLTQVVQCRRTSVDTTSYIAPPWVRIEP